jgi:hypothetical protein
MTKRKTLMWIFAASGVVLVAVLIVWLLGSTRQAEGAPVPAMESPIQTVQPTPSASPVPLEVSSTISKLPADPGNLVSLSSPFRSVLETAFPSGTTARTVEGSWTSEDDSQGVVQVDISRPGAPNEKYAAMMVREDGQWKVLATVTVEP